jgi:hypothetical protein
LPRESPLRDKIKALADAAIAEGRNPDAHAIAAATQRSDGTVANYLSALREAGKLPPPLRQDFLKAVDEAGGR